jgi:hypothetical protein
LINVSDVLAKAANAAYGQLRLLALLHLLLHREPAHSACEATQPPGNRSTVNGV